jgi:hypothetical protein
MKPIQGEKSHSEKLIYTNWDIAKCIPAVSSPQYQYIPCCGVADDYNLQQTALSTTTILRNSLLDTRVVNQLAAQTPYNNVERVL